VSGVDLDLTGRKAAQELKLQSAIASGCRLALRIFRRCFADKKAEQKGSERMEHADITILG
jgi:hypothetical protein